MPLICQGDSALHPSVKFRHKTEAGGGGGGGGGVAAGRGSVWARLVRTLVPMFYGEGGAASSGGCRDQAACSSCQSLASDGHRVRYM